VPEPLLDYLSTGVVLCDGQLKIQTLNNSAEALLNVSLTQASGIALARLAPQSLVDTAKRALESGRQFSEHGLELGPDSTRMDLHYTPLGQPGAMRLLIELAPAPRQLAQAVAEQQARHQAAMQALLRGLAHEVKNPLGGLRGAAQLMQRQLEDPALRQYTQVIIEEADRLATLVDRFSRPPGPVQHQPVNIHRALERVRQLVSARSDGQLQVLTDYDPSVPAIPGDLDRLVQGLLNLANNALEAGASRLSLRTRIRRNLSIGASNHRSALSIDFIDNGGGLTEELKQMVFYPLVSGRSDGSGLGLSVAQTIAAEHGGQVVCHSEPGQTIFSWLMPVAAVEDQ